MPIAKLTEASQVVQLLRQKFSSGEITAHDKPKTVWEVELVFRAHKLDNFRTKFNQLKSEFMDHDSILGQLPRSSLNDEERLQKKPRLECTVLQTEDENGTSVTHPSSFNPLHVMSEWIEPASTTKRLTIPIVLPSGINSNFTVLVSPDSNSLLFTVNWPSPIVNLQQLHRKWLTSTGDDHIKLYHPKLIGFEKFLKQFRQRNIDHIESTATLPLPFQVQNQISDKCNLSWTDSSTRVVYVELRGREEQYNVANGSSEFEVC